MMPTIWLVMSNAEVRPWRLASGKLTSTTMSRSTPMLWASSTGRLSTRPPSTSRRPFTSTGVSTPGADMLARRTVTRSPWPSTTRSPVSRSVASARNGVGNWSKSCTSATRAVASRSTCVILWPCTSPSGSVTPSLGLTPSAPLARMLRSSCLRRYARSRRGARSRITSCQSRSRKMRSISSPLRPAAYRPPTTAPMLVPATASTGIRISSSARMTPTWAAPRAPPPLSTRPMRGRADSAATDVSIRVSGAADAGSAAISAARAASHAHGLPWRGTRQDRDVCTLPVTNGMGLACSGRCRDGSKRRQRAPLWSAIMFHSPPPPTLLAAC